MIIDWVQLLIYSSVYLTIGLVYSMLKTYFYGKEEKEKFLNDYTIKNLDPIKDKIEIETMKKSNLSYTLDDLKGHVFRWCGLWIFSIIVSIFKQFLPQIGKFIWKKVGNIFNKILLMGYDS